VDAEQGGEQLEDEAEDAVETGDAVDSVPGAEEDVVVTVGGVEEGTS
jgi:hypothetical protein